MGRIMQLETNYQPFTPLVCGNDFFSADPYEPCRERVTLDEAVKEELIEVVQIDNFNHIPQMKVSNHSARKILLFNGREIIGQGGNRVLTISITLRHNASVVIPAFFLASTYFFDQGMMSIQKYLHHFTAMDNQAGVVYRVNGRVSGERYGDFPLRVEVSYSRYQRSDKMKMIH